MPAQFIHALKIILAVLLAPYVLALALVAGMFAVCIWGLWD